MLKTFIVKMMTKRTLRRCMKSAFVGKMFQVDRKARIHNEGGCESINVGDNVFLGGTLMTSPSGKIVLGSYSWIAGGVIIGSADAIKIGDYVGIAAGTHIFDNNNHSIEPEARKEHRIRSAPGGEGYPSLCGGWDLSVKKPIVIADNVWIGMNCFIGKGVSIGEGAIIARQSVVTKDVPPYVVVAGNPAKIVKNLKSDL